MKSTAYKSKLGGVYGMEMTQSVRLKVKRHIYSVCWFLPYRLTF